MRVKATKAYQMRRIAFYCKCDKICLYYTKTERTDFQTFRGEYLFQTKILPLDYTLADHLLTCSLLAQCQVQ